MIAMMNPVIKRVTDQPDFNECQLPMVKRFRAADGRMRINAFDFILRTFLIL